MSSVSMPKATKGPVTMSPQYPRAATRSPRWRSGGTGGGRDHNVGVKGDSQQMGPKHRGYTHIGHEAPRCQCPVGHMVGAGIPEFEGHSGVPPLTVLAAVNDLGLGWGRGGERASLGGPICWAPQDSPDIGLQRVWMDQPDSLHPAGPRPFLDGHALPERTRPQTSPSNGPRPSRTDHAPKC